MIPRGLQTVLDDAALLCTAICEPATFPRASAMAPENIGASRHTKRENRHFETCRPQVPKDLLVVSTPIYTGFLGDGPCLSGHIWIRRPLLYVRLTVMDFAL